MAQSFSDLKLGNQLCFAVYTAAHAFVAAYRPVLDPLGLTYPQYLVLLVLGEEERLNGREISRRLGLEPATVAPLLKRMEKAGLISRMRDAADERHVRVSLTDKGRDLMPALEEARRSLVCSMGWTEAQVQEFKASVLRLAEDLRPMA